MNLTRYSEEQLRDLRKEVDAEIDVRVQSRITPSLRRKHGQYAGRVKVRVCKGCGKEFSGRELRTHPCTVGWPRR